MMKIFSSFSQPSYCETYPIRIFLSAAGKVDTQKCLRFEEVFTRGKRQTIFFHRDKEIKMKVKESSSAKKGFPLERSVTSRIFRKRERAENSEARDEREKFVSLRAKAVTST